MYSSFYPLQHTVLDDEGVPRLVQQAKISYGKTVDVLLFDGTTRGITFEDIEGALGYGNKVIRDKFGSQNLAENIDTLEALVVRFSYPPFPALVGESNEV